MLIPVYLRAKVVTESKGSRKPKAYFQFWAFHVFATSFVILTVIQNYDESNNVPSLIMLAWVTVLGFGIGIFKKNFDIETPTHFCRCCHSCSHCIVLWMSLCSSLFFISFALFSIPTIILVYYLYPARTLLRLPLLTNAILYINSLLALLLFQCERLFYHYTCIKNVEPKRMQSKEIDENSLIGLLCGSLREASRLYLNHEDSPLEQRAISHNKFYSSYYTEENCLIDSMYLSSPMATMITLAILILFVIIIHDLTDLHISSVKDLNLNLLLTLAPTLLLLFVSWYKFDIFYDLKDEEEKSKKEILKEILKQEKLILEKITAGATNEDRQPDTSDTTPDLYIDVPIRRTRQGMHEMSELTLDTAERDTDTLQASSSGDTTQATRPEEDATRDTGDVVTTQFATESDITPATGGEATGGAVSGETTPLIVNHKPDDYKTMT